MTIKEQAAQMERQAAALRELRELLTEPWDTTPEPERTEAEELRAQLQHQAAILQRIVEDAVPVDGFTRRKYELILDAETLESIRTASRYPATLPPRVTATSRRCCLKTGHRGQCLFVETKSTMRLSGECLKTEKHIATDEGCPF